MTQFINAALNTLYTILTPTTKLSPISPTHFTFTQAVAAMGDHSITCGDLMVRHTTDHTPRPDYVAHLTALGLSAAQIAAYAAEGEAGFEVYDRAADVSVFAVWGEELYRVLGRATTGRRWAIQADHTCHGCGLAYAGDTHNERECEVEAGRCYDAYAG